ncbi:protein disulfide-isomerase [Hypomesus transpacificus]|uniref:protein disulfide-isomerase n=1 Tax=Hypomesus transpacificus TaxID=137520 RepID=UPI001F080B5A|nr:protein disulfide-isomerase [Hypomesus transpacificus]
MKLLLLFLLAGKTICVCVSVSSDTHSDTLSDTHSERGGGSVGEDGVLQLNRGNFKQALKHHKQLLVHFFAPLSGEGQRVAAEFRAAALQLQRSEVKLGVVDVSKEKELARELNATAPPSLRLYQSGDRDKVTPFPGLQTAASIVTWLKRRAGPSADLITDLSQSDRLTDLEGLVVLGLFKDLQQGAVQVFYAAAIDLPDLFFYVSSSQSFYRKYNIINQEAVLLLKQSELQQVYDMSSQTSKEELILFITVHQMDLVTEYTGQTAAQILSSPVLSHALLFVNKSSDDFSHLQAAFSAAAAPFRGKLLFVLVDVDEPRNGRMLEYFRVRDVEAPLLRLVNLTDHVTYQLPSDTLDTPTITHFCQSYLEGKAKPRLQSEPAPADWDQRLVKELVGSNLERVAFNPDKTVFILFYLPYSQRSRSLFLLWEELGTAFLSRDDVVIARIDTSSNDINLSLQEPSPALILFPALHAERVVIYRGKRTLEELRGFLEREMEKASRDRIEEEQERKEYIEAQKAAEIKEEL